MAINSDKALETSEEGVVLSDDNGNIIGYLTALAGDPTGSPAPVNTWVLDSTGPRLWLKHDTADTDWRILGSDEIPDILNIQSSGWTCVASGGEVEVKSGRLVINSNFEKHEGFIKHTGFIKGIG